MWVFALLAIVAIGSAVADMTGLVGAYDMTAKAYTAATQLCVEHQGLRGANTSGMLSWGTEPRFLRADCVDGVSVEQELK